MSKIVIDPDLHRRLHGLNETVAIEDEEGKTLGRFVPEEDYHRMLYAYLIKTCPVSEEQIQRIRAEKGGRSLQEILVDLETA